MRNERTIRRLRAFCQSELERMSQPSSDDPLSRWVCSGLVRTMPERLDNIKRGIDRLLWYISDDPGRRRVRIYRPLWYTLMADLGDLPVYGDVSKGIVEQATACLEQAVAAYDRSDTGAMEAACAAAKKRLDCG